MNWEGVSTLKVNSFDHAGTSILEGLTRTLTFYGTLMNQVSGSIPEECHSPGDTSGKTLWLYRILWLNIDFRQL
jgi:hypothetical protein